MARERVFAPRKSVLDGFVDILGVVSDKEVAKKASSSPENVRAYRMRRSIPATFRGETLDAFLAKEKRRAGKQAVTKPARRKKRKMRRRRKSRLDPYLELVGDLSDRELADRAGVTPENVRAYRVRRGIPARWRGEKVESDQGPAPVAGAAARAVTFPSPAGAQVHYAYKVVADVGSESREYVVFAGTMADAALQAASKLQKLHSNSLLRELTLVGEAL